MHQQCLKVALQFVNFTLWSCHASTGAPPTQHQLQRKLSNTTHVIIELGTFTTPLHHSVHDNIDTKMSTVGSNHGNSDGKQVTS